MHLAIVACRWNYRGWDVKDYKIRHILKRWRERWWWLGPERRKMDRCEVCFKNRIDDLVTNWMYREREKLRMTFRDLTRAARVHSLSGLSCKTNSRTHHWCTEYRELHTELGNYFKTNKAKLCAYFWYSAFLTKLCELKAIIYMRETHGCYLVVSSLMAQWVKKLPAMQETQETWVQSLGWEDPLEEEMETHSSILAWKIPWTEEPGGL